MERNNFLRAFFLISFLFCFYVLFVKNSYAIYDPASRPNNKFGIHILFTSEINDAARLVNSSQGDWGYVTIPIQYGDRNLKKWQEFMDNAKQFHLIPIIRLATNEDPFKKGVWRKPNFYDLVDFSNFLNSLDWPTKNRYVVLFNEVNRLDEWGGQMPNPSDYADLINAARDIFKQKSDDFFLIVAGLDNAASNTLYSMNEFTFLKKMYFYDSNIFNEIDGFASHSYPNPAFISAPNVFSRMGVATYKFEENFINLRATSKKPAFITETGWDSNILGDDKVSDFYRLSFQTIWDTDSDVVAVTPFLLKSQNGPFDKFSFIKNGEETEYFNKIKSLVKVHGIPELAEKNNGIISNVLGEKTKEDKNFEYKNFSYFLENNLAFQTTFLLKKYFKIIFSIKD